MKYLILLTLFLMGCSEKNPKCVDGFMLDSWNSKYHAFCFGVITSVEGIKGIDCYAVTGASPRGNYRSVVLREGGVYRIKCYNIDRDN